MGPPTTALAPDYLEALVNEERAIHLIVRLGNPRKSVVRKIDGKWWVITMRWKPRMVAFGSHARAVECAHALEVFNRRPR